MTMGRLTYRPDDLGNEIEAPSGHYRPLEEGSVEYDGRRLLYTLGAVCIESSCCGIGNWNYLRVEGYLPEHAPCANRNRETCVEIETVEDSGERAAIAKLLTDRHPNVRIEFR